MVQSRQRGRPQGSKLPKVAWGLGLYKLDDKVRRAGSPQSIAKDEEALWQAQTSTCWTGGPGSGLSTDDSYVRAESSQEGDAPSAREGLASRLRASFRKQKRQSLKPRHDFRARQLAEAPRLEADVSRLAAALAQQPGRGTPTSPDEDPRRAISGTSQSHVHPSAVEASEPKTSGGKRLTRFATRTPTSMPTAGKPLGTRTSRASGTYSAGAGWYSPIPVVTRRVSVLYEASKKADVENAAKGQQGEAPTGGRKTWNGTEAGHDGHQKRHQSQASKGGGEPLTTLGLSINVKEVPTYEEDKPPDRVSGLAKQLRIPLDILKQAYDVFDEICMSADHPMASKGKRTNKRGELVEEEFDVFQDGELNIEGFAKVLCRLIGCASTNELPDGLVQRNFRDADGNSTKSVSFLEFAFWYSRHGFMENMLLTTAQLEVRELARKYDMPVIEVEQYKKKFDLFDEDQSGYIEYPEFENLIGQLVKVPANCEFPPGRIKQFWAEADRDRSSAISFEEFLLFFYRYFSLTNPSTCPFKEYYRGIRRVPGAH